MLLFPLPRPLPRFRRLTTGALNPLHVIVGQLSLYGVPAGPKSKPKIFDSAVALFTERLFYSESLLVSALIKITFLVENPSRPGRRELPIGPLGDRSF